MIHRRYHFSVDDVFESLLCTDGMLDYYRGLSERYSASIGLYLFFCAPVNGRLRCLSDVPSLRRRISGGDLKFGPHSAHPDLSPFEQPVDAQRVTMESIYSEIDRFAGRAARTAAVRLHHYSECYELASYWKRKGVTHLFTTHRPEGSWRMGPRAAGRLLETGTAYHRGMGFIRSQFRVEGVLDVCRRPRRLREFLAGLSGRFDPLVFYTHEYALRDRKVRAATAAVLSELGELGVKSVRRA